MLKKLLPGIFIATFAFAQYGQAPRLYPDQLDNLVGRIALYPDPLLAQVLTSSTYWNQIPDAAGWANQHRYLNGGQLAQAINDDRLPWDASVLALLPFPNVLDMLARDPSWTQQLGNAVLSQRPEVMDAVQRERQKAMDYGYLQNNQQERIVTGGAGNIQILPTDPGYLYVPTYDPRVVYYRPRPGFFVGGAINFGPRVVLGASFAPWGWGGPGFDWRAHNVIIDRRPWERTWVNRDTYVHPYERRERIEGPRVERHERDVREHSDRGHDRDREHH